LHSRGPRTPGRRQDHKDASDPPRHAPPFRRRRYGRALSFHAEENCREAHQHVRVRPPAPEASAGPFGSPVEDETQPPRAQRDAETAAEKRP
jgi:hypothetical protein